MHSGGGNAWMKIMGIKDKKKTKKEKKGELETLGSVICYKVINISPSLESVKWSTKDDTSVVF